VFLKGPKKIERPTAGVKMRVVHTLKTQGKFVTHREEEGATVFLRKEMRRNWASPLSRRFDSYKERKGLQGIPQSFQTGFLKEDGNHMEKGKFFQEGDQGVLCWTPESVS